jgi:hypothetical protein
MVWTEAESCPVYNPILEKKVKTGDGGAITTDGSNIYTTKGAKQDFWKYTPGTPGIWTAIDTVPLGPLAKKGVPKAGAALVCANNMIYLLKGNNNLEFWAYGPVTGKSGATTTAPAAYKAVMANNANLANFSFDVSPNPFNKLTTVRYSVPVSGNVSIKLYSANGSLIQTIHDGYLAQGSYSNAVNTNIACGIYFLRYEDINNKAEIKLINK